MFLMIKNLTIEIQKNRMFLILLFIMTVFTSFLFFFIRFSIDANMMHLKGLSALTDNQQNYLQALKSNTGLALIGLIVFTLLTALVFAMFYFRFISSAKKQVGIFKALGAKNISIQMYFVVFALVFSLTGLLIGILAGYFGASIPMNANSRSYNITGLQKGINIAGVLTGIGLPLGVFALTMLICGFSLYKKDNNAFLSDIKQSEKQSKILSLADVCVRKLPIKNKAPLRIAIRKPISALLIVSASIVFTVMLVLGWSLTQSSEAVYKTQTDGHHYLFDTIFEKTETERIHGNALYYLSINVHISNLYDENEQTVFGMDFNDEIYSLKNVADEKLELPENGTCYIPIGLSEMYDIKSGEKIIITTGNTEIVLTVKDIAYNAKSKTIIVSRIYLAGLLGIETESFNGVLSMENLYPDADKIIDNETRLDSLARDKVSNETSAILNQSIGLGSGLILIFLALFIAFQDSIKDMLIMDNLGYTRREIKKLLINVFLPILIIGFVITAYPAVLIAKGVQLSLALTMGDYMPFSTNIFVLLAGLAIIVAVYWLVQLAFNLGIKHITKKKGILEYTNSL